MNSMRKLIFKKATGLNTLFFMTAGIALDILLLAKITPKFIEYSKGLEPLDLLFGFSAESMFQLFDTLGKAGRDYYLFSFHGVDYFFTVIMGIGITLTMSLLFKKTRLTESGISWLHMLPLLVIIFDLIENISLDISLFLFPVEVGFLANVAALANVLKNSVFMASFLTILVLLVRVIIVTLFNKFKKKK